MRVLLLITLWLWSVLALAAQELVLGIFPYVTPEQLVKFHSPLRQLIADTLGRPVSLVTAPDFKSFVQRTQESQYDIILTAPHMGRLAEARDGYRRIASTGHEVQGIFLVSRDAPYQRLGDLNGKTIMMAQRISLLYQMSEQALRKEGLRPGQNVQIIETRTHNNAMYAPLRGEADAAMTGIVLWEAAGEAYRDKMREIGRTESRPGFMLMARRDLPQAAVERLRAALLSFDKTPAGRAYFEETKFKSFREITDKMMREMDPYVTVLLE